MSEEMDKAFENVEIYRKGYEAGYEAGIESLQSQWISVETETPPDGSIFAFNAEYAEGHIHRAISVDGGDYICESETINSKRLYKVTHWMPLPNPPIAPIAEGECITTVIQYEDGQEIPQICANMEVLGGRVIGVQFNDALEELEAVEDRLNQHDIKYALDQ